MSHELADWGWWFCVLEIVQELQVTPVCASDTTAVHQVGFT